MIDVVLPALDEAAAVGWVLGRMPSGFRAIVVDNGSTDATASIARAAGAAVVSEPIKGFGAACWAGLQATTSDVVCFMDCDASLDPVALPLLAGYVERDEADLVIGERIACRGAWPLHARVANRVLAAEVRRRTKMSLPDLGPMRVMRRDTLLALGMTDRRSGWPLEMVLRAAGAGLRLRTVPVEYHERAGRSKVTGTVRGTARAVIDMSRFLRADATVVADRDIASPESRGDKRCT
jgi:glycosyltransferase involved in cell wall biosynthesis